VTSIILHHLKATKQAEYLLVKDNERGDSIG
jgi:hypothetical protein